MRLIYLRGNEKGDRKGGIQKYSNVATGSDFMHSARFKWHTTHLPIVLAASLGVFVVVFIILGLANQDAVGWIRHTSQVRASLSMLSADLMETTRDRLMFLETGQKGFLSASASAQQIMIDRLI